MTQTKTRADPRSWDFLLTTIFVIFMILLAVVGVVIGLGMGFSASLCAEGQECSADLVQWGTSIMAFAPASLALIFTVAVIVRITKRRITFAVALLGIAMMLSAMLLGFVLFDSGMAGQGL